MKSKKGCMSLNVYPILVCRHVVAVKWFTKERADGSSTRQSSYLCRHDYQSKYYKYALESRHCEYRMWWYRVLCTTAGAPGWLMCVLHDEGWCVLLCSFNCSVLLVCLPVRTCVIFLWWEMLNTDTMISEYRYQTRVLRTSSKRFGIWTCSREFVVVCVIDRSDQPSMMCFQVPPHLYLIVRHTEYFQ